MKCTFIILVIAFASARSQSAKDLRIFAFNKAKEECASEKNISMGEIMKTEAGDFSDTSATLLNCFTECFYNRLGFIRQGSVSLEVDVMRNFVRDQDGEQYVPFVEDCAGLTGMNLCELSYNVYKCFTELAVKQSLADVLEEQKHATHAPPPVPETIRTTVTMATTTTTTTTTEPTTTTEEETEPPQQTVSVEITHEPLPETSSLPEETVQYETPEQPTEQLVVPLGQQQQAQVVSLNPEKIDK